MLDKQAFYHGTVIQSILDTGAERHFRKEQGLYFIDRSACLLIKYTTKARSPWRFTLSESELRVLTDFRKQVAIVVIALVCGGDGICALEWDEVERLVPESGGWISCKRRHNTAYGVAGQLGSLNRKVPLNRIREIF